mmetsp:Transcript_109106/g.189008  ORF Transcript_109106/g.189008 Transcript_109106/m.189008 type:complete len:110 (+) Transcript_109106:167-496(+)
MDPQQIDALGLEVGVSTAPGTGQHHPVVAHALVMPDHRIAIGVKGVTILCPSQGWPKVLEVGENMPKPIIFEWSMPRNVSPVIKIEVATKESIGRLAQDLCTYLKLLYS